jgi:hypothetical protein
MFSGTVSPLRHGYHCKVSRAKAKRARVVARWRAMDERRFYNPLYPFAAVLAVIALLCLAAAALHHYTPPQHNPFKPLDLASEPGLATGFKLDRLAQHPQRCFDALDRVDVGYTRISREGAEPECAMENALTLGRSLVPYSATLSMSCPLAAAVYVWERHVVIPAAAEMLDEEITRIETFGSYSCRRVNGARTGRWSEHATGNALDISGFRLAGRTITVEEHFGEPTAEGRFLEAVRNGACDLFSATLSPDYNAIHHDHLHLDMGLYTICS